MKLAILAVFLALPLLASAQLPDGSITGPEKISSAACAEGETFVKGSSVWACGTGSARTYLGADVTEATGAAYTTIFTIPLTMTTGKEQVVRVILIQSSDTTTTAIQNRARLSAANATGSCWFLSSISASVESDVIALATSPADTGNTAGTISTDPYVARIDCAISPSNTTATDLVIDFQAETATNVTTHAGSWYELVVN